MTAQDQNFASNNRRLIATIGFGEAAQALVKGWKSETSAADGLRFAAFDIKTSDPATATGKQQNYAAAGVAGQASMADLLAEADTVFCLVTADQAAIAAAAAAPHISPGTFYFDGNSCAPKTKQANAVVINAAGGRYVDTAILAPVNPKLHRVPILLSGPDADAALEILTGLGMDARVEQGPIGRASSIKMIRSIMVKGMEALTAECLLAARLAGVEDIVMNSLAVSGQGIGGSDQAAYNLERMMQHGIRRAAEMREVAITVADLGLPNGMATATADWQQVVGDLGLDAGPDDFGLRADAILASLGFEKRNT
ncbi:MAG: DUF1932 domain-containing protein [Rhodobacter sp.]|mgnify:CR=1 FL=1|jgi:3-hydroxyisobutyrate dehydrogenase-like beta-hydroxyacid dehydrogenase|nr:DUF1932 domain-containing protein [Rhodobacter sp.]